MDNLSIRLDEDVRSLLVGRKNVLQCIVSGWPRPAVKWLMNGKELRNGDLNQTVSLEEEEIDGEQFSLSLHFSELNIRARHAVNFTCDAKNKYHTKRRDIQVSITCPPTLFKLTALSPRVESSEMDSKAPLPPTIVSSKVVKCGRAVKVEWSGLPPTAKSAISPITGYQVHLKSDSDDSNYLFNLSREERSHEFVGLKINAVYEVSLRGKNSKGFGLWTKEQLTIEE
ncbi:hypothetical protein OS493_017474 [Desmophyllum pertusum]|uniref:Uncharacterized protein n=1 Tax=Desmophyllum pertusum TaxID=174260 RepID=A0A9X0D3E4_9CNID|nr:hypothetical protein OS493_017474 [Desmophyllum pertusum]